jgi:hypothetical protein
VPAMIPASTGSTTSHVTNKTSFVARGDGREGGLMKRFASLIAIFAFPTAAIASNWMFVDNSQDGSRVSIDLQSISRNGSNWLIWVDYAGGPPSAPGEVDVKVLTSLDCSTRATRSMSWASYGVKGTVVNSYTRPSYDTGGWTPAIPDSIGDEILSKVCSVK